MERRSPHTRTFRAAAALTLAVAHLAVGAPVDTRVSLVAADLPGNPPCSTLDRFGLSPFGGLIATQWVGGARLDGLPVFQPRATRDTPPVLPGRGTPPAATGKAGKVGKGTDALLIELDRQEDPGLGRLVSPLEFVDEQYRGKTFFKQQVVIGPKAVRHSVALLPVTPESVLEPGPVPLRPSDAKAGGLTVPCYPVHLQARGTRTGRRTAFALTATWRGLDLLTDLAFDYSPDLPEGVPAAQMDPATGRPRFFDLTLYVPATDRAGQGAGVPYLLNGVAVHVFSEGLSLGPSAESRAGAPKARAIGGFALEFESPEADEAPPATATVPFGGDLPAGVGFAVPGPVKRGASASLPAIDPANPAVTLRYAVGGDAAPIALQLPPPEFPNVIALCKAAPRVEEESVVYMMGAPLSAASRDGRLRLHVTAWTARGQQSAPTGLAVRLDPFPLPVTGGGPAAARRADALDPATFAVDVKDLSPGLYRVRFPGLFSEEAAYEFVVCLSKPGIRGSVTLFTHHNRCDYRQGESIEVTVALRAVDAVDRARVELVLTADDGAETAAGSLVLAAAGGGVESRQVTLAAGQLQPGRYRLGIRPGDGSLIAHPLSVTIFPKELSTTWEGFSTRICETGPFRTTEGLCAYRTLQNGPTETLLTREDVERYAGQPVLPVEALPLCRVDPLFPVEESVARYDETERTLAAALRFGVQHLPHATWGLDNQTANWNPKHSHGESLDWMRRMIAQRTQIHREFASFGGFFLNWYPLLGPHYESHPPAAGFAEFEGAALQKAVQAAQGPLPDGWAWSKADGLFLNRPDGTVVKESDVLKEGLAHPLFNSPAQQELVEWKLRGQRRRTQAFATAYGAWTEVSRTLGDWDYLSFVPVGWFRGPDYYPPLYFSTLPRVGLEAYTDWQADPFMELFGIDYYGAGSGKPAWVQMMSGGRNMQIRQTLLSAARGAWGVGCDTGTAFPRGRAGEDARQLSGLMHRYGPWFMGMTPVSDVAIVRSLRQEAADAGEFRDSGGRNGLIWFKGLQGELWSLYYNLLRSGRPAAFITEEEIAAGGLARYKAVFLHRQRLLMPPALMKRFDEYVAAGGKVFKDPDSAARYPGEVVNLGPDESLVPDAGTSEHIIGSRYVWLLRNYLQCRARLEAVLARLPPPVVRSDHHHLVTATLDGKDAAALFVINDTPVPSEVQAAEKAWFIQGSFTLARKGTLSFDKPYFLYDVTEGGREEQAQLASSGRYVHPVEFLRSEGRIFVMSERPVCDVRLKAQWRSGAEGDVLRVEPAVLDDQGRPFVGPLPFELALRDPAGREVKRCYRAAGPSQPVDLALGRNLATGTWSVAARELATGREATADLVVTAAAGVTPLLQAEGRVLARRPGEVSRFLAAKKALTIILDEGQPAAYRQAADGLAAAVRQTGRSCDVLQVDPLQVCDLPLRWRRGTVDSNVWNRVTRGEALAVRRGLATVTDRDQSFYDHPNSGYAQPGAQFACFRDVILIGSPRDNRLIADLHGAVNRPASAHCPGPGGALVQVTWDAFAPRFDALSLQVGDAAGLAAGCAWLVAAFRESSPPPPVAETVVATTASTRTAVPRPLPNVQRDGFGTPVGALQPVAGGRLLVSLAGVKMSGSAHYLLEADGRLAGQYPDILGTLTPMGPAHFLQTWRDTLVWRDGNLRPLWQLGAADKGAFVAHPETRDLYQGGDNRVTRLDGEGRTVWVHDFSGEARSEADFLKPWKATVQGVSADGQRLLVAGYREKLYGKDVAGYEDAAVLLMEAATGAVLWRKSGLTIRGTACSFVGDRIVACNSGDSKTEPTPNLVLLDATGKVIREVPVPARLARVRPFGKAGLALVQQADGAGVGLFDLEAGRSVPVAVPGTIKEAWILGDRLAVATWDGTLRVFDEALHLEQTIHLSSPAGVVVSAQDGGLIVGTDGGQIQWIDTQGTVSKTVDLAAQNLADEPVWARRWLAAAPAEVPVREFTPWAGPPTGLLDRARAHADVSPTLVKNGDFEQGSEGWSVAGAVETVADGVEGRALRFSGALSQSLACKPGTTYGVSLFQRHPRGSGSGGSLTLRVAFKGQKDAFQAGLPLSPRWEERTASFRPPPGATEAMLTLAAGPAAPGDGAEPGPMELDRLALCAIEFRSANLLLQRPGHEAALDAGAGDLAGAGGRAAPQGEKPAEIRQTIPWTAHLARASGQSEVPPRLVTPWTLLVDGRLAGHESSWTGKPLPQGIFSDHAEMSVTFAKPRRLNVIALYEDAADPARYTRRFAVFARTATGVRLLGYRENNRSPYNLLTFDTVNADSLLYLWDGSGDGHVRLMEIEAYLGQAALLDR